MHSGAPSLNGNSADGSSYTRTWPKHHGPPPPTLPSPPPRIYGPRGAPARAAAEEKSVRGFTQGLARRAIPPPSGQLQHHSLSLDKPEGQGDGMYEKTWGVKRRKALLRDEHTHSL